MPACELYQDILEDEPEWDEASRRVEDGDVVNAASSRALCQCGRPLHRYARLPRYQTFLMCSSAKDCTRCGEDILPGDMHFVCPACSDVHVCKDCGPSVYIHREYDFLDYETGEVQVQEVPKRVLHDRRGRSVTLEEEAPSKRVASKVFEQVQLLAKEVADEEDVLDKNWEREGILFQLLGVNSAEQAAKSMLELIEGCQRVLMAQPSLTEVEVPCKIYGDIHGQLRDLLLLFHSFGLPGTPDCPRCVFNGDFVDRGRHQAETIVVLFALKVMFPMNIYLNRGNHEDTTMNHKYGFQKVVQEAFGELGPQVYQAISTCFQCLPFVSLTRVQLKACLVGGRVLALHGGIGDGKWRLDDLRRVRRPVNHEQLQAPENRLLWNILWSDPIEDDCVSNCVFGVHDSQRSKMAVRFGWNVTQDFCVRNGLDLVVRSHQSKRWGLGFDVMHNESLVRVFSARDYENNENDGAVLQVQQDDDEGHLGVRPQVLRALENRDDA
ncbi:Serine/threonine-protein phosphatase BSU1 (Bri1 suppressor protein 1) [Durusdinium trenchii]|uniref:Serine/threonine-protein phosphatase n=1 Tax=Durusdinium trenchii TaxID=1381693 RepID=A0ABP0J3R2_9DINO